jgi:hypothetical protein
MSFQAFEKKCQDAGLSQAAIDAFKHNYDQLVAGETGMVSVGVASCGPTLVIPSSCVDW